MTNTITSTVSVGNTAVGLSRQRSSTIGGTSGIEIRSRLLRKKDKDQDREREREKEKEDKAKLKAREEKEND
jgi:hypothetical protein